MMVYKIGDVVSGFLSGLEPAIFIVSQPHNLLPRIGGVSIFGNSFANIDQWYIDEEVSNFTDRRIIGNIYD